MTTHESDLLAKRDYNIFWLSRIRTYDIVGYVLSMFLNLRIIQKSVCDRFCHHQMFFLVLLTCQISMSTLIFDMFWIIETFPRVKSLWTSHFRLLTVFLLLCEMRIILTWISYLVRVIYLRKQLISKTCTHDNITPQQCNFHFKINLCFIVK
jgi:hypothetical protein